MESDSLNGSLPSPKRLKTLAADLKGTQGNNLLHKCVLDNSDPNALRSANYINAVLSRFDLPSDTMNALNAEGLTPLHIAIMKKNLILVKKLLSFLVNIDINSRCCTESLHYAGKLGNSSLMEGKAGVKRLNPGYTPALLAVKNEDVEILKIFVTNSSDITQGKELFWLAARLGKLSIIKFLVERFVYVDCKSETGHSLQNQAAISGDVKTVEFCTFKSLVNARNFFQMTLLHYAVRSRSLQVIEYLVKNGADIISKNCISNTALHYAVEEENLEIVEFLIRNGAAVNTGNVYKETPLHYAVREGNLEVLEFLLTNGAAENSVDYYNETPPHLAV